MGICQVFKKITAVTIQILDTWIPDSSEYRTYCMSGFQMAFWHLWTQTIRKPDNFVLFSNGLVPQMSKYHSKTGLFCPDFKWHLKTGPFKNRTHLDHSKTRLVQYSGGSNLEHSNTEYIQKPNVLKVRFRMVQYLNGQNHSYRYGMDHSKTKLFLASLGRFINKYFFYLYIKQPSLERPFFWPFENRTKWLPFCSVFEKLC